jgi:uncharacterized protein YhdP
MLGEAANELHRAHVRALWRRVGVLAAVVCVVAGLGVLIAKSVMARVPEQRASIERLLKKHTGLDVRFGEMYVSWGWRGPQAVLRDVELADPVAKRFRTAAPEIRVELDSWGLIRPGELSIGRVTLVAATIDVDLERVTAARTGRGESTAANNSVALHAWDRYWIERLVDALRVLPDGRINVESATLNLRGGAANTRSVSVSRAVMRRDADSAVLYGTFLLPEQLGKTLFVSVEARGVRTGPDRIDGKVRVIARNAQVAALARSDAIDGLMTLDLKATLAGGRLSSATWQGNLRRLAFFHATSGQEPLRFVRADVTGAARRRGELLTLDVEDFRVTPATGHGSSAAFEMELTTDARTGRLQAPSLSISAAQLLVATVARAAPGSWPQELDTRVGALQDLSLHWNGARPAADRLELRARATDLSGDLPVLGLRFAGARGELRAADAAWHFEFDAEAPVRFGSLVAAQDDDADPSHEHTATIAGVIRVAPSVGGPELLFESIRTGGDTLALEINGRAALRSGGDVDIAAGFSGWDAPAARDFLRRVAPQHPLLPTLAALRAGRIVRGETVLAGVRDDEHGVTLDPKRVRVSASVQDLTWQLPAKSDVLTGASADIEQHNGALRIVVKGGRAADMELVAAQMTVPAGGVPRFKATALARLESPRLVAAVPLLSRLDASGTALVEFEGDIESHEPRVRNGAVRVSDGRASAARGVPELTSVQGAIRFADGRLVRSQLAARWLGGDVDISLPAQSAAVTSRPVPISLRGTARADALPGLFAMQADSHLAGAITYTATLTPLDERRTKLVVDSSLTGLESSLPVPFEKRAARALPTTLALELDARGVQSLELKTNRNLVARGSRTPAGFATELRLAGLRGKAVAHDAGAKPSSLELETLDVDRMVAILVAARALSADRHAADIALSVADLRVAGASLGPMRSTLKTGASAMRLEQIELPAQLRAGSATIACDAQCRVEWRVEPRADAELLRIAGFASVAQAASIVSRGTLTWPGSAAPSADTISGRATVSMREGVLQAPDASERLARALAAPAFVGATAPEIGFPVVDRFEDWSIELALASGEVVVDRWSLDASAGSLTARGSVSVEPRTHAFDVQWTPRDPIADTTFGTASRPKLAAVWSSLRNRVQQPAKPNPTAAPPMLSALRASVSGGWDTPVAAALP